MFGRSASSVVAHAHVNLNFLFPATSDWPLINITSVSLTGGKASCFRQTSARSCLRGSLFTQSFHLPPSPITGPQWSSGEMKIPPRGSKSRLDQFHKQGGTPPLILIIKLMLHRHVFSARRQFITELKLSLMVNLRRFL